MFRNTESRLLRVVISLCAMVFTFPAALSSAPDAATYVSAGKKSYERNDLNAAQDEFQKAVDLDPANSEYALWLGRTWGRKAEGANLFAAPRYASHAREWFEKAVALSPRSIDALSDLFDYYLNAPALLGGGIDKAADIARRLAAIDKSEGEFSLAKLELKQGRTAAAEQHFRAAVSLAPAKPDFQIALARVLAQESR